jgi:dihydroceramidase
MYPSTVDWCEANYVVSNYIAEFWNSVSGSALLISVLVWRMKYQQIFNQKLTNIFGNLLLVSLGTTLFHATLQYKFQLLDELPMLMTSLEYVNLLINLKNTILVVPFRQLNSISIIMNTVQVIVWIIPVTYFIHPHLQIATFHTSLKFVEGSIVYTLYKLSQHLNKVVYDTVYSRTSDINEVQDKIKYYVVLRKGLTRHVQTGLVMYLASMVCWVLENMFCEHLRVFQLHAWWHLLSAIGIYNLNRMMEHHTIISNIISK